LNERDLKGLRREIRGDGFAAFFGGESALYRPSLEEKKAAKRRLRPKMRKRGGPSSGNRHVSLQYGGGKRRGKYLGYERRGAGFLFAKLPRRGERGRENA